MSRRLGTPLRGLAMLAIVAPLAAAVLFHLAQNRFALIGGEIAFAKSLWLGIAVLFWIVLPALILGDPSLPAAQRRPFRLLLVLMGLRALIELYMLYVTKSWRPVYGITHDLVCLAVLWGSLSGAGHRGDSGRPRERFLDLHLLFTGALFIPECGYAWYMQTYFDTFGADAIYFVPDDEGHRAVLRVTALVNAAALVHLAWFLHRWLYGRTDRRYS